MINYSIKDLERISGIKAHTLRIWEQRYNLLKPSRTDSNIRFYSNEDLKFILNISLLNRNGYKISRLAKLSEDEINKEVLQIFASTKKEEEQIEGLVLVMIQFDEAKFHEIINHSFSVRGVTATIENILFPFLKKTGIMWQAGSIFPAQEHFISNLIREKIIAAIHDCKRENITNPKKVLLFLPEEELHEISLLFYYYIIKQQGHLVYYLGQAVPYDDILKSYDILKPDLILTVITQPLKSLSLTDFLNNLITYCHESSILVSGYQFFSNPFAELPKVILFKDGEELRRMIE